MAWLEKLINFLKENWELIKENYYTFIIFAIICISLTLLVNKLISSAKDKKIEELNDEVKRLQEEVESWQKQYDNLQDKFKNAGIGQRLLSGADTNTRSPLSENMSKHINEKYSKDK